MGEWSCTQGGGSVGIIEVECIAFGKELKFVSMVDLQFSTMLPRETNSVKNNVMGSRTSKEEGIVMGEI